MKYLIIEDTEIADKNSSLAWGVDKVLVRRNELTDLANLPQEKSPILIFIPTILDYNISLSYDGTFLALKILLYYLRIGRTDIDIILMGNESASNFMLHFDYPNFLKIPGVYYVRFNREIVKSFKRAERNYIKVDAYRPYLENLGLKKPSSLKSTHSLTNEWCLFKWNLFMGFKEDTSALDGHPYFDFLITIEKLNHVTNKKASDYLKEKIQTLPESRVLLIDDKLGWHTFFKEMFKSSTNVELRCLGADFSKLDLTEIGKIIKEEVNTFDPHLIILDFRLMEDKDADCSFDKISGGLILKELKGRFDKPGIAFGRQVLIFTATSRIENILRLKNQNADGFILKEKPEQYASKEITKNMICGMVNNVRESIHQAKFLMQLNNKLAELEELESNMKDFAELKERINTVVKSVRLITQKNNLNEDILKISYLNIFAILELLKENRTETLSLFVKSNASNSNQKQWEDINAIRNSIAHGDPNIKGNILKNKKLSGDILLEWTPYLINFITTFLNQYLKK